MELKKIKKLVIVGAGETAEIAYEYFMYDSEYEVVAFSVESQYLEKEKLFDLPVVPFEDVENYYPPNFHEVFVAVSYTQLNRVRTRLYHLVKQKGFKVASYISSKAFIWRNVEIGENCFIFENNVIQYQVKIGNNVVIWSGNHIGHHSVVGDNCFISSHVVISGFCEIGENSFLGVNATLANNLKIGKDNWIGPNTAIMKSTGDGDLYRTPQPEAAQISAPRFFKVDK